MKDFVQDINEMTDSKEIMESKPTSFINWFIYILLSAFIIFLIWAYFGIIDETVSVDGTIRPKEQILTIGMPLSGKIVEYNVEEAQEVKAGDILFIVDTTELSEEKEHLEEQLEDLKNEEIRLNNIKNTLYPDDRDLLFKVSTSLFENQTYQEHILDEIKRCQKDIDKSTVVATKDGTIHFLIEINIKDKIEANTDIINLIPQINQHKVIMFVSESDIAKLRIGQNIDIFISAFPRNDYGNATGIITSISADAQIDEYTQQSFYLVETSIEQNGLKSNNGEFHEFKIGMSCQIKILIGTKNILFWMIEKLN